MGISWETITALISAIALLLGTLYQGAKLRAETAKIKAELRPNSGHSMRDQIVRIEGQLTHMSKSIGGIRDDARADREALRALHDSAIADHADIRKRLATLEERTKP